MAKAAGGGLPDLFQARRFLRALCNLTDDEPDRSMTFQTVDDRKEKGKARHDRLTAVYYGTLSDRARVLSRLNADGAGIFFQVGAGARGSELTAVRALVIDDDCKDADGKPRAPIDLGKHAVPGPSAIVQSSPVTDPDKRHYYWWLHHDEPIGAWIAAMKVLAIAYGADVAVADKLSLCMRLPGFYHCKKQPQMSRLVELHPTRRYKIAEVLAPFRRELSDLLVADGKRKDDALRTLKSAPETQIEVDEVVSERFAEIDRAIAGEEVKVDEGGSKHTTQSIRSFERVLNWLDRQGRAYSLNPAKPRFIRLAHCPLNKEHTDAVIIVRTSGATVGKCFHQTCGGNKQIWAAFRDAIGGWHGLDRGDHPEMANRLLAELRRGSDELVYADSAVHRYEPRTGAWERMAQEKLEQHVQLFAGLPIGLKHTPLKLKWGDVTGICKTARSRASRPEFFRRAPEGALFANGFLAVRDEGVELVPHSPDHRARDGYPFPYEPGTDAPRWLAYLREVFEGDEDAEAKIVLLQEFLGACLLGVATRYQAAFWLIGEGSNGKSVMLKVFKGLFPADTVTAVKPQEMDEPYMKALLHRSRLNIVAEVPEQEIIASEAFKAIVDGSTITGRHIREAPFSFEPVAGELFACNRLPPTADFTHGFWRRQKIVPFNRRFDEVEADRALPEYIVENERAGVVNWGIAGACRLLAEGAYSEASSADEAMNEWKEGANPVAQFLSEETEPAALTEGGTTEQLYQAYAAWAATNGYRAVAKNGFAMRLRHLKVASHLIKVGRSNRRRFGLRLAGDYAHFQQ